MTERATSRRLLYDPVTGLVDLPLFEDRLAHAMDRMSRWDHQLALLVFSIESLTDRVADDVALEALLRSIGHRMRGAVRKVDTLARLGSYEFALIAEDIRQPADALVVARKLEDVLGQPFRLDDVSVEIAVRGGIAVFPFDGNTHTQLWSAAVAAGNQASESRDVFVMADPELIQGT